MFRRDIKKQFNENKYSYQVQTAFSGKKPYHHMPRTTVASILMVYLAYNMTRRYIVYPDHSKDFSKPDILPNG